MACHFFVWQDVQMAVEKKKHKYELLMFGLKMKLACLREEKRALQERNNELQEEVVELMVERLHLKPDICSDELCMHRKEELREIKARLSGLDSKVSG
ncbi:unnamed protein product [Linum trigynum]|uniref:Uncharacterized protein n=1 Tax=Linum trigynum TaxID=586398 RepID=A0AAV2GM51_9ROSI